MSITTYPAGTAIRNLEATARDRGKTSWIRHLEQHAPALKRHDATHCAAYKEGFCQLVQGTLCGAHVKLADDAAVRIIPLCHRHNIKRSTGLRLLATRAFPALLRETQDKGVVAERIRTHASALLADASELHIDVDPLKEAIEDLEKRLMEMMRPHTMRIIALSGRIGSGKTTCASILERRGDGAAVLAFADPLKLAAQALCDFSHEQLWGDAKEAVDAFWGFTPRYFLQRLGTEGLRELFGTDFFVRRMRQALLKAEACRCDLAVIHDCRFIEEYQEMIKMGAVVVHVRRGPDPTTEELAKLHASERGFPVREGDYVIRNDGTLEDLERELVRVTHEAFGPSGVCSSV